MIKTLLTLTLISLTKLSFGQQIEKLEYCNCIDKIDSSSPFYEGKYERVCNGKTTNIGSFKNNLPDGEWISYNYKGGLISRRNYSNGVLNGLYELYFLNGKLEFSGSFLNGKKNGVWKYFNEKGLIVIDGEYELDKPINLWTVKNQKGKKILEQYDYTNSNYVVNEVEHKANGSTLLGGKSLAGGIFSQNVEVPKDYWDTYADQKYLAIYKIEENSASTFILNEINEKPPSATITFGINTQTNAEDQLHKVEHSKLSKKLLYYKIFEGISILPPWIYKDEKETTIYIPYKVNMR